ncbi:hypothetical protein [Paradevosia shaoguanensis]|uniref:Uncharacterized protein n=1 Tax=Paradevosia shaoguanensis TaxID=1335043 RepID=A0AA41UAD7_9HYPH|nr:hypothetical protein [Paradevosia shaoguanensis]MCF1741469.1 hypothetical protein [Paradevosia shaoguanensis]MCI0125952.1 hypothetical protein [Paradevosia shaoguanensis]
MQFLLGADWEEYCLKMTVLPTTVAPPTTDRLFDILTNPFVVLNAPLDASKEDVVAAFEDGLADNNAGEDALRDARKQLLAPKLRLQATVELLPDATYVEREEAINALRQSWPLSELIAIAKTLPSFSRTIFLSQIALLRPSSGVLRLFALSRAQLNRDAVAETVAEYLISSGNPRPQTDAIYEVIEAVTLKNAERLFGRYDGARSAAVDMTRCLQEELPRAASEQTGALGIVVDAYARMAMPTLQVNRRKVEDAADAIRQDPDVTGGIETLVDALTQWDEIAQPQQLLASHKGRDEGAARDLFQYLRSLMLDLANEKDRPSLALAINKACLTVFAELPRAKQQLKDDQTSLEGLVQQERLHELSAFVTNAKSNPDPLVRDLNLGAFGPSSRGSAASLYDIFTRSLAMTKGTPASKYVWGFARALALELNNELGEETASQRLVEGLHAHPQFRDAPPDMKALIETDVATARSNAVHRKLNKAIQAKNRGQVRDRLTELVSITKDPAERAQYQQTINQIDAANRGRIINWVVWAVICLVVVGVVSSLGNRGRSYSSTHPSYSALATSRVASTEETKPAVGAGKEFNRQNIRYCMYQNARLDAAKSMLVTERSDGVIAAFNQQVDDFNSRCGSYRYYDTDFSAVQSEVGAKRAVLTAEGQAMVQVWRAKF